MIFLSFVIPTRNGMPYLMSAVDSILAIDRTDFELIVCVNDNNQDTENFLAQIKDSRIRVIRPGISLSISANYEYALSFVHGEWVQFLGSDDSVYPWFFDYLLSIIQKNPDVQVVNWVRALYFWPGLEGDYGSVVYSFNGQKIIKRLTTRFIRMKVLLGLKGMFEIPQLYTNSVVRCDLITDVRKQTGMFFCGLIPDIYSSVAISSNSKFYIRSFVPLTLVGSSVGSIGIGTRVYDEVSIDNESVRYLEETISDSLHRSKHQPYFYLESVRKYQRVSGQPFKRSETLAAFIGMLALRLSKQEKSELRITLSKELRVGRYLTIFVWYALAILGRATAAYIKLATFTQMVSRGVFSHRLTINSHDRNEFPEVITAMEKTVTLWRRN